MADSLTTVHLLRHGEVFNPTNVLYERLPDFHLSDTGRAMAQRAAEFFQALAGPAIVQLYASPLVRAQETAQPISQALDLPIQTEPAVIEAQSHFAGQVIAARRLLIPTNLIRLVNPLRPSWGEAYQAMAERMHGAIATARQNAAGAAAVIVSHQSPIWRARLLAEGRRLWPPPRGRACSLASVTSLTYQGDRLVEVAYCEPAADLLPEHLR